jgi:hypothetical protein
LISPAQAAESVPALKWPSVPTIGTNAYEVITDSTGGVTVGCTTSNGGSNLVSYDNTGSLTQNIDRTTMIDGAPNCIQNPVLSKTGVIYGVPSGPVSGNWVIGPNLLAYGANGLKWKYPAHCDNNGAPRVAIGADGNIYVATYGHIIGLKPELDPGQTQPTKIFDVTTPNDCSAFLRTYKDGLILHGQSYGNARYYSYAGKFLGQAAIGDVWYEQNNADGRLFVGKTVTTGTYKSGKVSMYDPRTGLVRETIASTLGANVTGIQVYPVSGGGVVAKITEQKMISGIPASPTEYITTLAVVNASGIVTKSMQLSSTYSQGGTTGAYWSSATYPVAAGQGKLAVLREMYLNTGVSYPSTVPAIYIGVYDIAADSWTYQQVMSGDLAKAGGPSGYYLNSTGQQYGVANNVLYLAAKCSGNCATNVNKLFPIDIGGLSLDYPRGEVLTANTSGQLQSVPYVAMGDSFSSGEGVLPFEEGTDVSGGNQCHRSELAYAKMLSRDPYSTLSLQGGTFVACSGAETKHVTTNTFNGESRQVSRIISSTKVVSITIGGNDIGFMGFATDCVLTTCQETTSKYIETVGKIQNDLPAKLAATYRSILSSTVTSGAEVYVLGYPYVTPARATTDGQDVRCPYLYNDTGVGGNHFPWEDAYAARDIVKKLNDAIDDAVALVKTDSGDSLSRLHYVSVNDPGSPFAGHEVCSTGDSFFQNLDQLPGHPAFVFHPNAKGQEAYADILKSYIASS